MGRSATAKIPNILNEIMFPFAEFIPTTLFIFVFGHNIFAMQKQKTDLLLLSTSVTSDT